MNEINTVVITEYIDGNIEVFVNRRIRDWRKFKGVSQPTLGRLVSAMKKCGLSQYDSINFDNASRYVYTKLGAL